MTQMIATLFGLGHLRPAPGTWGSAGATLLAYALHIIGGPMALVLGTAVAAAIGWWATESYLKTADSADPSEIVIDELLGQWVTFLPIVLVMMAYGLQRPLPIGMVIVGFLLFRLFDIVKPWPVSWADQQHGTFGVMMDDVIAGLLGGASLLLLI